MSEINKLKESYSIKKIDKETINLKIFNNNLLMSIVGPFNSNLTELEKLTNTTIYFRGNSITVKGENHKIKLVSEAVKFLINKFLLTNVIEKSDINLSLKNCSLISCCKYGLANE